MTGEAILGLRTLGRTVPREMFAPVRATTVVAGPGLSGFEPGRRDDTRAPFPAPGLHTLLDHDGGDEKATHGIEPPGAEPGVPEQPDE